MKKVAIIQSNYIPWKGYFDIIHDVDQFIFLDDVQYTLRDWRNRNKIKAKNGLLWLSIPVGNQTERLIYEVEINDPAWAARHWEILRQYYATAPYFNTYKAFFEDFYLGNKWVNLSDLNQYLITTISKEFLGIQAEFIDSRGFNADGHKTDRLINVLVKAKADLYVSGPTARAYIDENRFKDAGIELVYKDYAGYPEYPQSFPPFEHAVSIVDMLFNCGPQTPEYIWGWREKITEEVVEYPEKVK